MPDKMRPRGRRRGRPPTTEQLRNDIDSGSTADKVAHPDPAAAPLGTDDEAGGTPSSPEQITQARRQERVTPPASAVPERRSADAGMRLLLWLAGIVIVATLGLLAATLLLPAL